MADMLVKRGADDTLPERYADMGDDSVAKVMALRSVAPVVTAAAAASKILKAAAGTLFGINAVSGGSAGYVMLFDSATVPADGTVTPVKVYVLAANSSLDIRFVNPLKLATGGVLVFSTTGPFSKTASATAFLSGDMI